MNPKEHVKKEQTIVCSACKKEFPLRDNLTERNVGEEVIQHGIICPHCQAFTHAFFETPRITEGREGVDRLLMEYRTASGPRKQLNWQKYQTARDSFNRMFKHEQNRWRRKRKSLLGDRIPEAEEDLPEFEEA